MVTALMEKSHFSRAFQTGILIEIFEEFHMNSVVIWQLLKHSDDISSSDNYQEFHGRLIFDHNIDCQLGIPEWNYDRYS